MQFPSKNLITELLSETQGPCISLYMPTHREFPDRAQDPIRFRNMLKELEERLPNAINEQETAGILEPFQALAADTDFWSHTMNGLAVFAVPGRFRVVGFPVEMKELLVIAGSFHTKPLRHFLQSEMNFQVLGLSLTDVQLFEGNRHGLTPVQLPAGMPATLEAALGEELTEKHMTVASYGGVGGSASQMRHGHGDKKDEIDKDTVRFFKIVSDAVYENFSKSSGLPLVLAALPEHHSQFHKVSSNPLLQSQAIGINYKAVSTGELAAMAWQVLAPAYEKKLNDLVEKYGHAKAHGTGVESLARIAEASAAGRVDTLMVEADRIIPGKIRPENPGKIITSGSNILPEDDLLDDIAETVTRKGGRVMVLPPEKMPTRNGIAAIFRY